MEQWFEYKMWEHKSIGTTQSIKKNDRRSEVEGENKKE